MTRSFRRLALGWVVLWWIVSCVPITVNIYFEPEKAERAADKVLDRAGYPKQEEEKDQGRCVPLVEEILLCLDSALCPDAEADDEAGPDLDVDSATIREIEKRMKDRFEKYFDAALDRGNVGLDRNAVLSLRNLDGIEGVKEMARFKAAVKEENKDREDLFLEVARLNKLPKDAVPQIRRAFLKRYRARSRDGWWYQTDDGDWVQKGKEKDASGS